MPEEEESRPVIAFYAYPGGPPITFRERLINDDLDPEIIEQRSYLPSWAVLHHHTALKPPNAIAIASLASNALISRELALAATRQLYLRYSQLGIDPPWHYRLSLRKAILAASQHSEAITANLMESSGEKSASMPDGERRKLEDRIKFLEAQLESQMPHLKLYRLGAGSLLVSVISIVVWLITGTGIPFHPIFAGGVIPVSLGVIAMAFLVRTGKQTNEK